MNKFVGVLVLGSALALSACGGDSDSSGSSNNNEIIPAKFLGLPNCVVDKDSFTIKQDFFLVEQSNNSSPTCLVKVPDLNNGRTFALSCNADVINDTTVFNYQVGGDSRDDLDSIGDDIQEFIDYLEDDNATTSDSKYGYLCI
ncbi:hypothetical protein AAJP47_09475 [Psychrobacter sp. B38]|uniref:hypothetical protein n=1 Tax=Psychrobacter sp. B38 TaxID=3143538 RepID=UPI00320C552E